MLRQSLRVPIVLLGLASGLFLLRVVRRENVPAQSTATSQKAAPPRVNVAHLSPDPAAPSTQAPGANPPANRLATGTTMLHGAWGSRAGAFGRRQAGESNPEGPMGLFGGIGGEVAILDQVNRRVERYRGGRRTASIALGSDTAQDLALAPGGKTVVLDRLVEKNVQIYGEGGALRNEVPLDAPELGPSGALTGVFADDNGVYVEREHNVVVRIADADGLRSDPPEVLPGRPSRDGQLLLSAAIVDRQAGQIGVSAAKRSNNQPLWTQSLSLGSPILHILLLDSDRQGHIYVAAATGHESSEPPYPIVDETLVALQLGSGGAERGRLELPPLTGADESFRPLSVDDDGALLVMRAQSDGLFVTRYSFP